LEEERIRLASEELQKEKAARAEEEDVDDDQDSHKRHRKKKKFDGFVVSIKCLTRLL